jgi:hypothetical protein
MIGCMYAEFNLLVGTIPLKTGFAVAAEELLNAVQVPLPNCVKLVGHPEQQLGNVV